MLKKYNAIVFDLGGVLYDIDVQRTIDAFAELDLHHFERIYTLKEQAALIDALEKGLIGDTQFADAVNMMGKGELTFEQIKTAWNALLINMPKESVDLLKELKEKGYKLYLLSNTNIFHFNAIHNEMEKGFGINGLDALFDKTFYSFRMGMRKPDAEIYLKLLADTGLNPDNAIFIDDNEDNIRGAIAAGLPGICLKKGDSLKKLLVQLGIFSQG